MRRIILIDFKIFIEHDSNPFILFTSEGKVHYLNTSAEILMGAVTSKELFTLAVNHAPKSFGYNKSLIDLSFGSFKYYGINVVYENEAFLGLQLYNKPMPTIKNISNLRGYITTDINLLLQANIELFNIDYKGKLELFTDYNIPKFKIYQNNFSMLLRGLLLQFSETKKLYITMKIKIGERVRINEKQYPIVELLFEAENREHFKDENLEKIALEHHININLQENSILLEIPAIN